MHNLDTYSGRVASKMRDRMDGHQLSVTDLADRMGVAYEVVLSWRDGIEPIPLDMLPALAGALGYRNVVEFLPSMTTAEPEKKAGGVKRKAGAG